MRTFVVLLVLLVLAAAVAVYELSPPSPLPEDAPATAFSAGRAWRHVETLARAPRPSGSAAHTAAREYLLEELRKLGLQPETQTATAVRSFRDGFFVAGRPINVLARVAGTQGGGGAVLLMAHYDSAVHSPGAADDGSGVAVLLETARALLAGEPLRNDVLLLFSDVEEAGLSGAEAFVTQHPWAEDVRVVVNFEARGTRGPALMFETGAGNLRTVRAYARAVPHKTAASYTVEVYRRMPNDTDYSVFRDRGVPGLNFAFVHGAAAYHYPQDSPERLSPASVQDQGQAALALARHLGGADLDGSWTDGGDAVYTDLPGSLFLLYPASWALPLALLAILAVVAALVVSYRAGRFVPGRSALALLALLVEGLLLAVLLVVAGRTVFGTYSFALWGSDSTSLNLLGVILAAAGLHVAVHAALQKRLGADATVTAGLVFWSVLALLLAVALPGASYLAAPPLLMAAVAAGLAWREAAGALQVAVLAVLTVSVAFLWAPFVDLVGVGLGFVGAALGALLTCWLLGGLLAGVYARADAEATRGLKLLGGILAGAGVVLLVAVRLASVHGPDNRRPVNLFYVLDADQGEAHWYSQNLSPAPWVAGVLGEAPEKVPIPPLVRPFPTDVLRGSAPVVELPGATVEVVEEERLDPRVRRHLRVDWPYDVHRALLRLEAPGLRGASIDGQVLEFDQALEFDGGDALWVSYVNPAPDGIDLEVETETGVLTLSAAAQRYVLPSVSIPPRPPELMPNWALTSDSTFVLSRSTYE